MSRHTYIAVKDETFTNLPEIKAYCPCYLEVKDCKVTGGQEFKVGRLTAPSGCKVFIFPLGNELARKTCDVVFRREGKVAS